MNQEEALELLLSDRLLFIKTLMQIEDKSRQLVPFEPNKIQTSIIADSTGRDVYVKPAQVGASSIIICDYLVDVLTIPGTTAVIISYDEFITGRLLAKARAFYTKLLERIPSIPKWHHKSTYEMTFPDVNGSFYIGSAGSFTFGRGETIHDLLLDEYAFYQPGEAEKIFASALQRVPLTDNTKVKILSTPNGMENDFYETYTAARDGKSIGKSVFTAHFYPWYEHYEYSMKPDSPFARPNDDKSILDNLSEDEKILIRRLEQMQVSEQEVHNKLRWRRYKMAEMESLRRSGGTQLLFGQEYPEDDSTCFLSSGNMVHDANLINDKIKQCFPADLHLHFADIWEAPKPGVKYLVAVDPGKGRVSESVATVWTFSDEEYKHHATLSGLYDEDKMAEMSVDLAKYYNNAILAPEDNLDIVSHMKDYDNLYYRTDPVTGIVSRDAIGWKTTRSTKPYMVTEINRAMPKITCYDRRIWEQMKNIRWIGNLAAPTGSDDYYMSVAIAIVCRDAMPVERGLVGVSGWSNSWGKR